MSSFKNTKQAEVGGVFNFWQVLDVIDDYHVECFCIACCKTKKILKFHSVFYSRSKSCGCKKHELRKQSNLKKYGVEHALQSETIKDKMKETNRARYGVEHVFQSENIKKKIRNFNLENYGVNNYTKTKECQDKRKITCLEKYGVEHHNQIDSSISKIQNTKKDRYGVANHTQLPEYRYKLRDWCEDNPHHNGSSKAEQEMLTWIRKFYPNAKKHKKAGNELDIFIPEINLGIEHNGLWHHCEDNKNKNYHLDKTKYFTTQGIRVIHIWENEWKYKKEQVKSFIQSAIGKNNIKIGARKCEFIWSDKQCDKKEVRNFLDKYHLQGAVNCRYVIKINYNNELVGCATFGKHHRNSKQWVLSRFCSKRGYTISGGLAKLTKKAYSTLQSPIISWADQRLSRGNGYACSGWIQNKILTPDYFYCSGLRVFSKQSRQKKLVNTPKEMTEKDHAVQDGLRRVWDCGKIRFIYQGENK